MNDLEKELQKLRTHTAPQSLDRRVAETLQTHQARGHMFSARIPLWAGVAACVLCFAGGMWLSRTDAARSTVTTETAPAPVEFSYEDSAEFAAFFEVATTQNDFFLQKKRQINSTDTN